MVCMSFVVCVCAVAGALVDTAVVFVATVVVAHTTLALVVCCCRVRRHRK